MCDNFPIAKVQLLLLHQRGDLNRCQRAAATFHLIVLLCSVCGCQTKFTLRTGCRNCNNKPFITNTSLVIQNHCNHIFPNIHTTPNMGSRLVPDPNYMITKITLLSGQTQRHELVTWCRYICVHHRGRSERRPCGAVVQWLPCVRGKLRERCWEMWRCS